MVASVTVVRPTTVDGLRIRITWYGKAVLQVRYKAERLVGIASGTWEPFGCLGWRDMRTNDAAEIAAVFNLLRLEQQ